MPDREELEELYTRQKISTWDLADKYDVSQTTIRRWLIKYGIPRRTYKENKMPVERGGTHNHGPAISKALYASDIVGKGNLGKRREDAPNWKGGEHQDKDGRWLVWNSEEKRYYHRAILVWLESHPNESLGTGFVVHHKDLTKDNDSPDNLVKMSIPAHTSLHRRLKEEASDAAGLVRKRIRQRRTFLAD